MVGNKRRSDRKPMFRVCRYNIEGRSYADLSTNISERGIFIKNFSPPPVGTAITLTVTLPEEWGNLPMRLNGRVAWINESDDPHQRGMGIAFTSVLAESLPIIEYFVREVYEQDDLQQPRLTTHEAEAEGGDPSYEYELDIEVEEP
jgi:uncharacterized protein (TIGR02266 family)